MKEQIIYEDSELPFHMCQVLYVKWCNPVIGTLCQSRNLAFALRLLDPHSEAAAWEVSRPSSALLIDKHDGYAGWPGDICVDLYDWQSLHWLSMSFHQKTNIIIVATIFCFENTIGPAIFKSF